jgi:hypothetical protein
VRILRCSAAARGLQCRNWPAFTTMKTLTQAVKRNLSRFPEDFMFRLTAEEWLVLRSQIVTSKGGERRGGRRYAPVAFTEQGVAMLSSVLRSERAVRVNIEIMRAFVEIRRWMFDHEELANKVAEMERKYDAQFADVFAAIRELLVPPDTDRRRIGYRQDQE